MQRAIGLRGATAINVIAMIGIGPLVTLPLVLSALNGPLALIGWIAGALVALCDGLVWAELSSQFPGSGGTYVYLREAFGKERWGRLFAFLFNWQILFAAPCLLASGYIGLTNYAAFAFPLLSTNWQLKLGAEMGVGVLLIALLWRRTARVAALGIALAVCAIATLLFVIAAAFSHFNPHIAFAVPGPIRFDLAFLAGLGSALFVTLYDYAGYSEAALLGDEVRDARRTIPRSIVLAVVIVAILYVGLQIGVLGAVPWQSLITSAAGVAPAAAQFVAATVVENAWGHLAALTLTILVIITAFASVYGLLFGSSRVPYAAAIDGEFPSIFGRLHKTGDFPWFSLLVIGGLSLVACLFTLDEVIAFLTTGIVIIQGVMQIVALVVLRQRGERAPFRVPLFPIPLVVALAGWTVAFVSSGTLAIALGVGWLLLGAVAYVAWSKRVRRWPFAVALLLCAALLPLGARAAPARGWSTWNASAVVQRDGYPIFTVGGKPFFVYGAAFFYERIPRAQWQATLDAYRCMGINTIDLYVMWNWHEPTQGAYDFDGHSNGRRDLHGLLRLIDRDGFKIVLRPGPVIRNEWRNGGYPDWLLRRPEYDMPLHDILEGRYPATATLQNAHADAAAQEWMANATHRRFATAWIDRVMSEVAPWSHDVIAIALDDDQGAYINNDTWPAPHWHAYVRLLRSIVGVATTPRVPVFINTYQSKVTAAAPVWAWGNWYQSDAYSIGDHDLTQLAFSTALLQTQRGMPVMASEFQAGWLQGADEAAPRRADPTNTTLALHELLQMGARGVVNFPVQDTLDPAGWEAPWANWFYDWDAALTLGRARSARYAPTAAFGVLVRRLGPYLATLHARNDLAIAWLVSAYDPATMTNERVAALAASAMASQQRCRALALTCRFVDLRFASNADLQSVRRLVIVPDDPSQPFDAGIARRLAQLQAKGGRIYPSIDAASVGLHPSNGGIRDATLMLAPSERSGILDIFNASTTAIRTRATTIALRQGNVRVAAQTIPARSARDIALDVPRTAYRALPAEPMTPQRPSRPVTLWLAPGQWVDDARLPPPTSSVVVERLDVYRDGMPTFVLQNRYVRAIVSADAGARAFVFENLATRANLFTTIGAARDAAATVLAPSSRDYIAAYTHPLDAGTFNRPYACRIGYDAGAATLACAYVASDLAAAPIRFDKTFVLAPGSRTLFVRESASAEALSLSGVADSALLDVACVPACTVEQRNGYRLIRADYAADSQLELRFTVPGAAPAPANPR